MTSLKLLHEVKKRTAFISACKCARELISFSVLWFLRWLNLTWLLSSYLHDEITSQNYVMTSLNMLYLSQLVDVLKRFFFFVFIVFWVNKFKNIIDFVFFICDHSTMWRYDVMPWLYDVTTRTPSILTCGVTRQMIRSLPMFTWKCRCLIRKCHSISTGMMTSLHAVTSWSWRLDIENSHFIYLGLIIYYNWTICIWTWSIGMWKVKAY